MQISGRWVILTILALALTMGGGAWWYRVDQTRRCAKFWGPAAAQALIAPEKVRLLQLGPRAPSGDAQRVAGQSVAAERDFTAARGLIHLQYALTQDRSFDWGDAATIPSDHLWARAIEFRRGDATLWVLLSADDALLGKLTKAEGKPRTLPCPQLAKPLRDFLADETAQKTPQ